MPRNRVPTNVLELRGSFRNHPERKRARNSEPAPTAGIGEAPKRFTKRQRAIWDEVVAICAPGVLANSHRLALDELVMLEEKRRYCEQMDPTDKRLWSSLIGRFGLTPSEMSKVAVPKGKEKTRSRIWVELRAHGARLQMEPMKSPAPLAGGKPGWIQNDSAVHSIADTKSAAAHLPVGTNFCQCASCHRYFGGVTGFDLHRVGSTCTDPASLDMAQDARGYWRRSRTNYPSVHSGVGQLADFAIAPVHG